VRHAGARRVRGRAGLVRGGRRAGPRLLPRRRGARQGQERAQVLRVQAHERRRRRPRLRPGGVDVPGALALLRRQEEGARPPHRHRARPYPHIPVKVPRRGAARGGQRHVGGRGEQQGHRVQAGHLLPRAPRVALPRPRGVGARRAGRPGDPDARTKLRDVPREDARGPADRAPPMARAVVGHGGLLDAALRPVVRGGRHRVARGRAAQAHQGGREQRAAVPAIASTVVMLRHA
jgi:hypothetical protein